LHDIFDRSTGVRGRLGGEIGGDGFAVADIVFLDPAPVEEAEEFVAEFDELEIESDSDDFGEDVGGFVRSVVDGDHGAEMGEPLIFADPRE